MPFVSIENDIAKTIDFEMIFVVEDTINNFLLGAGLPNTGSIYIYIYIHHHAVPLLVWISLIFSCHSFLSFIASGIFLDDILCPYRVDVGKFLLVGQLLPVRVKGSIKESH